MGKYRLDDYEFGEYGFEDDGSVPSSAFSPFAISAAISVPFRFFKFRFLFLVAQLRQVRLLEALPHDGRRSLCRCSRRPTTADRSKGESLFSLCLYLHLLRFYILGDTHSLQLTAAVLSAHDAGAPLLSTKSWTENDDFVRVRKVTSKHRTETAGVCAAATERRTRGPLAPRRYLLDFSYYALA
jgi:hypothetical protein